MSVKMEDNNSEYSDTEPLTALDAMDIADLPYASLVERKEAVGKRLEIIGTPKPPPKKKSSESSTIPYTPKTDTHWDFMLKEMMWLAADFAAERKRQLATGKKVASAVKQFHKTKETRRVRELAEAELKRRRLAGRIGREVKGWWTKIERVIAYKQKVEGDVERRKAMNKQLVALVHQTEKYGESLATIQYDSQEEHGRRKRKLTIEEALAEGKEPLARRSTKAITTDYARLDKEEETDDFYGEATTSDSGSDGSFLLETYSTDDESTLLEAEARELAERRAREESDYDEDGDDASYYADPDELEKLQEEAEMDVDDVVERFRQEAVVLPDRDADIPQQISSEGVSTRRVRFARNVNESVAVNDSAAARGTMRVTRQQVAQMAAATDPGNEADDDADASDVEDFVDHDDSVSDGSEEFEADHDEKDDETTIEAEERLGREMSASDEIDLLQQEGQMSIEDLRKMYSTMDDDDAAEEESESEESAAASRDDAEEATVETLLNADDAAEEDEFQPDAMEVDDVTTMEAEERLGREISYEQEVSLLEQEGEIPVEELRAMYAEAAKDSDDSMSVEDESQSQSSAENGQSLQDMLEHSESDEAGDEFRPDAVAEVDDETTMEAEERLGRDMSYDDEINLLQRENEMSVEDLRRMYTVADSATGDDDSQSVHESIFDADDHESEDEFRPAADAVDDETTMEEEERLGREMSVEDEIDLLEREGKAPLEDLKAMYKQMEEGESEPTPSDEDMSIDSNSAQQGRPGRKRSRPDSDEAGDDDDDGEAALEALKAAEEKARMTHATRPFLIAPWVKLREYQQIGLNWLVSIQTRRLNAILADEMVSPLHLTWHVIV